MAELDADSHAIANAFYTGAQIVSQYMDTTAELLEGVLDHPATRERDGCLQGLYHRVRAWMKSLEKLNQARDYQPIVLGCRTLLEVTVDMLLLHHDKTNDSGWKMFQWNVSAKMAAAEKLVKFYEEKGLPVPDEFKANETFYYEARLEVEGRRITLWGKDKKTKRGRHPPRWTGNTYLSQDIKAVDSWYGNFIEQEFGMTLTEFQNTEYSQLHWHIHSGVSSFWNLESEAFYYIAGLAFKWCADFAMLCTKTILTDYRFTVVLDELEREWQTVRLQRAQAHLYARQLPDQPEDLTED